MRCGMTGSPHDAQVPGLTARSASCARRLFFFECEVRRLGACMTNFFLGLSLSGAWQFKRPKCFEARVERLDAAVAGRAIQIYPAMRAEAAAIVAAQRTGRQCEQDLLANQRRQIDLLALVHREFQILSAGIVVVANRPWR